MRQQGLNQVAGNEPASAGYQYDSIFPIRLHAVDLLPLLVFKKFPFWKCLLYQDLLFQMSAAERSPKSPKSIKSQSTWAEGKDKQRAILVK